MHMHHGPVAPPDAPAAERLRLPGHGRAYFVSAVLAALILAYWTDAAPTLFGVGTDLLAGGLGGALVLYGAVTALLGGVIGADIALFLACAAAIAIGDPITAGVVAFMAFFGEALEGIASGRAHRSISRLVELAPPVAHLQHDDHTHDVPVDQVAVGDLVLVRPGERVPVDGAVVAGESTLDESSLTGESMPAERGPGDRVFAGTLNQLGALTVRAERVGEDTSLGQVIQLVADAQANKSDGERMADRYARRYFLPLVLVSAAGTWLLTGQVVNAVAVLVIACPCALVLATPAAVLAAMGRLASEGVVVKGGAVFERLARATTFAFDKTGTVTQGRAAVRRVACFGGMGEDDALRLAAAAESRSEHVFARAIGEELKRRGVDGIRPEEVTAFAARPGFGVEAVVRGDRVLVGNARLMADEGVAVYEEAAARLGDLEREGTTALLVARFSDGGAGELVAVIGVADTLRPDAHDALHALRQAGAARMLLLTGDRHAIAADIGLRLHIDEVHAEMLPADKAEVIRARQLEGAHVVMVGDGINDAPALAVADVGIAIGGPGRDITADAADVVLMGAPLRPLALTLEVSRQTVAIIRQNVTVFAIGLNTVAIGLAAVGLLPPMQAAVAHEIGSLAVLLNALRLLGHGRWGRLRAVRAARAGVAYLRHIAHRADHAGHDLRHWAHRRRRVLLTRGLPVVLLASWSATSVRFVATDEVGVVQRFGAVVATCAPGAHLRWPWPIETVRRLRPQAVRVAVLGSPVQRDRARADSYAIEWETVHAGAPASAEAMMTGDVWHGDDEAGAEPATASKLVQISAAVHYAVRDPTAYLLQVRDPDAMVLASAESVLRELVAGYRLADVLTRGRAALARDCRAQLSARLEAYGVGVDVLDVVLLDVHPDPGTERLNVIDAFRDVARAQAEQRETEYAGEAERDRLLAEAVGARATQLADAEAARARRVAVAQGSAARFTQHQRAFRMHPELARWRLFLDAVQERLPGRRKFILDGALRGRHHLFLVNGQAPLSLSPYSDRAMPAGAQGEPPGEEH